MVFEWREIGRYVGGLDMVYPDALRMHARLLLEVQYDSLDVRDDLVSEGLPPSPTAPQSMIMDSGS
jgi:hypothetical protein